MPEFHGVPLIPHDMPPQMRLKGRVCKDRFLGRWVWEHPCRSRGLDRPFHSYPMPSWKEALRQANEHVGWCP